jgi:oxalate decarboxylase
LKEKKQMSQQSPEKSTANASKPIEPIRDGEGANIMGQRNLSREAENRDIIRPPKTDAGTLPNMRWSFADSHVRIEPGGWGRQTTARELPISTAMAGVNMRLDPGGVRELHWHKEAEWGFVLEGRTRVTAIDGSGNTFQDDLGVGDLWYFPPGIPHSIQGLEDQGTEFLLVFNNGDFSEDSTFLLSDLCAHMPKEVLAKNFGWSEASFANIPEKERWIFQADVPGSIESDRTPHQEQVPQWYSHRMMAQEPERFNGGTIRVTDSRNFPAAAQIAAALVEVEPGALREIHWHPNGDEWQYYLEGEARMTVFASQGTSRTFDFQAGDVGYVPMSMAHYVENTGTTTMRFLEIFVSDRFTDVSLSQWMALTPHELVAAHLNLDRALLDAIPPQKRSIVAGVAV